MVSLNGPWRFDLDRDDVGVGQQWFAGHTFTRTINVPFPWQSELSGVHDLAYQGAAWYERDVTIPGEAKESRVFVVFGAVDWHATVWVNGQKVAEHEGGYTPFEVELTGFAKPGETVRLTLRAYDVTDPETPNGKQTGWYTPTGGIWQTVYLETRGAAFLQSAQIYPDIDGERATVRYSIDAAEKGTYKLLVSAREEGTGREFREERAVGCSPGITTDQCTISIPEPRLWTPDTPRLYPTHLELRLQDKVVDAVDTYFGMRKISRGTYGGSTQEYLLLNNQPIYLRGALHQSFNPKGIYSHPDDDFLRRDYEKAKEFGLNFLRIHIKVDEPRALYWADRLGIMLMCDMPNFQHKTDRAKRLWEETLRRAVARDFNHPAVIAWCNFNETWGIGDGGYDRPTQEWVRDMYLLAKQLDPTRLVEDNSACNYDHTVTDINSWHFYMDDYEHARRHIAEVVDQTFPDSQFNYAPGWKQTTEPLLNSEYGGVSAGSGDRDISWVFLILTNLLRKHGKICGYVYTELEDIEWEHNGFMNYDRSDKVYDYPAEIKLKDLQQDDFPVLDCPPYQKIAGGANASIPVLVSRWSERQNLVLRLSVDGKTVDGTSWNSLVSPQERNVEGSAFAVTSQGTFDLLIPNMQGLVYVIAELLQDGKRYAANYCVLHVADGMAWSKPDQFAVSFPVDKFSAYSFGADRHFIPERPGKVFGYGPGYLEYRLLLPEDLDPEAVLSCRLVAEIGAKADRARVDWPEHIHPQDYPQTDGRAWPTDVGVSLNDVEFAKLHIENDFADARGVLSHVAGYHHGSHGVVADLPLDGLALEEIKRSLQQDRPIAVRFGVAPGDRSGGLALYGAELGAYPADPTLVFSLRPGTPLPKRRGETVDLADERIVNLIQRGPRGHVWRYTEADPGRDWYGVQFDDRNWKTGPSGFGREDTPGARIGTPWLTSHIWLRTTVEAPRTFGVEPVWMQLHHDEGSEIYVNGKLLLEFGGYLTDYQRIVLKPEQIALFRSGGKNVIAVHCSHTGGGQFIDLSLSTVQ
ncbi:MAG: hypothetical protein HY706_11975 [Candidatus Hydrogenedentes bacterium]|nr:hypothetical protein [Candidatus Hydrogenedentota bacterium]